MTIDLKALLKPSLNWLFVFIPIAFWLEHAETSAPLIFFSAALAIIPIAHLIVGSTEKVAVHTGDAVGGLLNATFGNAPELIISLVALKAGMYALVLGSIAGALLANLLLTVGLSFLLGGLRYKEQSYNPQSVRLYVTMMLIATISLMVPSAFYRTFQGTLDLKVIGNFNVALAIMLLVGYGLYLYFSLGTHKHLFQAAGGPSEHEGPKPPLVRSVFFLVGASVMAAFMSELLVSAAEGTGEVLGLSPAFIGMVVVAMVGGAAESFSAVAMAMKDRMDMTLGIAMGSCIQIVLFVTPVLVISSLFMDGAPFLINFGTAMIVVVLLTVLMSAMVAGDGRSNWYKGVQLLLVYLIIALMLFFVPEVQ
jgi:Ca2+:H+ antiporter